MSASLNDLLDEYDRLGDSAFRSAHDFTGRQRLLAIWAAKARDAISELLRRDAAFGTEPQAALTGAPLVLEPPDTAPASTGSEPMIRDNSVTTTTSAPGSPMSPTTAGPLSSLSSR